MRNPSILLMLFTMLMTVDAAAQEVANAPLVVPNTTEAMQHAEFWIGRIANPDRVLLTPAQIADINARNRALPAPVTDINGAPHSIADVLESKNVIGLQFNVVDPLVMRTFPGDSLRTRFRIARDFLERRTYYDRREKVWDDFMKSQLYATVNEASVPASITPRYGILVRRVMSRAFPTDEPGYTNRGGWLDEFQGGSFDASAPVAVLHASPAGDWLYVRADTGFGWIHADAVAFATPAAIRGYLESSDFVIGLDYKVPVYGNAGFTTFMTDLYLGSRVNLVERTTRGYHVAAPYRAPDGSFATVDGWIKPDARVSMGYQLFTQRNMLTTAFNMLYQPYCWADADFGFDCCGMQRAVLRTCAIITGRWTSFILFGSPNIAAFPARNTPAEVKHTQLAGRPAGATFVGDPGHISMYIGEVDGRYYVIHQGGYSYRTEDDTEMLFRRVNVNDSELSGGSNVRTWTNITSYGE